MEKRYQRHKSRGHIFVFKYDSVDPNMLHITARHEMKPQDAISVFFDTDAITFYDLRFNRFETANEEVVIQWFWINENEKVVMIITCATTYKD